MAEDLVLTPGGYKPRKNVHNVPPGHGLHMKADLFEIRHPELGLVAEVGAIKRHASREPLLPNNIGRPRGTPPAFVRNDAATGQVGDVNGWVSYAAWSNETGQPIQSLSTSWIVPQEPANKGAQTLFLFNGIQNSTMIYQPVLQWGVSAAGGGAKWSVASWYADSPSGHSFYSLLVDVAVGTELIGVMSLVDQNGALFSYTSEFSGIPDTHLPVYNVDELTWANETFEAYSVKSRADFPADAGTVFSMINLRTSAGVPAMRWQAFDPASASGSSATIPVNSAFNGRIDIQY